MSSPKRLSRTRSSRKEFGLTLNKDVYSSPVRITGSNGNVVYEKVSMNNEALGLPTSTFLTTGAGLDLVSMLRDSAVTFTPFSTDRSHAIGSPREKQSTTKKLASASVASGVPITSLALIHASATKQSTSLKSPSNRDLHSSESRSSLPNRNGQHLASDNPPRRKDGLPYLSLLQHDVPSHIEKTKQATETALMNTMSLHTRSPASPSATLNNNAFLPSLSPSKSRPVFNAPFISKECQRRHSMIPAVTLRSMIQQANSDSEFATSDPRRAIARASELVARHESTCKQIREQLEGRMNDDRRARRAKLAFLQEMCADMAGNAAWVKDVLSIGQKSVDAQMEALTELHHKRFVDFWTSLGDESFVNGDDLTSLASQFANARLAADGSQAHLHDVHMKGILVNPVDSHYARIEAARAIKESESLKCPPGSSALEGVRGAVRLKQHAPSAFVEGQLTTSIKWPNVEVYRSNSVFCSEKERRLHQALNDLAHAQSFNSPNRAHQNSVPPSPKPINIPATDSHTIDDSQHRLSLPVHPNNISTAIWKKGASSANMLLPTNSKPVSAGTQQDLFALQFSIPAPLRQTDSGFSKEIPVGPKIKIDRLKGNEKRMLTILGLDEDHLDETGRTMWVRSKYDGCDLATNQRMNVEFAKVSSVLAAADA